jgi:hypothetical protein
VPEGGRGGPPPAERRVGRGGRGPEARASALERCAGDVVGAGAPRRKSVHMAISESAMWHFPKCHIVSRGTEELRKVAEKRGEKRGGAPFLDVFSAWLGAPFESIESIDAKSSEQRA